MRRRNLLHYLTIVRKNIDTDSVRCWYVHLSLTHTYRGGLSTCGHSVNKYVLGHNEVVHSLTHSLSLAHGAIMNPSSIRGDLICQQVDSSCIVVLLRFIPDWLRIEKRIAASHWSGEGLQALTDTTWFIYSLMHNSFSLVKSKSDLSGSRSLIQPDYHIKQWTAYGFLCSWQYIMCILRIYKQRGCKQTAYRDKIRSDYTRPLETCVEKHFNSKCELADFEPFPWDRITQDAC